MQQSFLALAVAFALVLTVPVRLHAQDADPVENQRKVSIMSYQRLAEIQKKPALVKAVSVVGERLPEFFSDGPLALLVRNSVASTKAPPPGLTKQDIVQARAQLQVRGRFETLKDKELRESLIAIIWTENLPLQIAKFADEAIPMFRGAKEAALGRACVANMKTASGAMEMYALDKNRPPPVGSVDQLMSELTAGGYLRSPIQVCSLDKTTPLVFAAAGNSGTVRCPTHGDPYNPTLPAGGDPMVTMEKAAETNPVVWATLQSMPKHMKQ
jgi:hypothetical protein